jgi:hypothetical protein
MLTEHRLDYPSDTALAEAVAKKVGVGRETARRWPVQYDGQLFSTSQTINFHARLGPRMEAAEAGGRARELAAFLSALASADDGIGEVETDYAHCWRPDAVTVRDTRYEIFYRAMFPEVSLSAAIVIAIVRSDLFCLGLLRELAPLHQAHELAPSTFKLRFVGLWQVLETLRASTTRTAAMDLTPAMLRDVAKLLSDRNFEVMRSNGARQLRNVLVHYGIGRIDTGRLKPDDTLIGLPQLLMDGMDWRSVDDLLGENIDAVLRMLSSWAGPFEHTLQIPHE